jgi:S1-C subfamily serine protease
MPRLGVDVANFDGALTAPKAPVLAFRGVVVLAASQGMPAWDAGIRAGDVIVAVNGSPVESKAALVDRLRVAADAVDGSATVELEVDYRRVAVAADTQGDTTSHSVPPLALLRGAGPPDMISMQTLTAHVSALLV